MFSFVKAATFTQIDFSGFESGSQGWVFGGAGDSERINTRSKVIDSGALGGAYSAHLQDDVSVSYFYKDLNLSGIYNYINLSFWYYPLSVDSGEYVQLYCDNTEVWRYKYGDNSQNAWFFKSVIIYNQNCTFDNSVRIRFTGSPGLSDNNDDIWADGINVTGVLTDTTDTTAPVISNTAPSGMLPYGTTSATLSLTTNENAQCKYSTTNIAYSSMTNTFSTTGATSHSSTISVSNGGNYTYYVRCIDGSGNANSASTTISFSVSAGSVNQAPIVNAGNSQTITLPASALLSGSASDDGLPNGILTTTWNMISGPGNVVFGNASLLTTMATFSAAGNYVLRLTASDGSLSSTSDVSITVNAASYLNRIVITPSSASLTLNANQQFNAQGFDQYNNPFSITPTWSVNGGAITQSGFYTANSIGNYLVSAMQNGITGNASVFVSSNSSTLTNGLIAYWKFDESSGSVAADSAGTRTGTLVNGATFVSGKTNNAVSFDGVNDYVSMSDISLVNNAYSFSFWFNYQSTSGGWGALFTDYDHSIGDSALFMETGSNRFVFWNNAAYYIGPTLVPNSWHHAVIIVNSGTATLYLDAVNSGTTSNVPNIVLSAIGSNRWPEPYKGMLDEVRVYNRILTTSEVNELYNYNGNTGPDVTAPVISNMAPSGMLPYGTTSATLSVTTNEAATCKYSITNIAYSSMTNTFSTTGGTSHSSTISVSNGGNYNYYVRCSDTLGNTNSASTTISFNVSSTPGQQGANLTFEKSVLDGSFAGDVKAVGDIDGDGYNDVLIGGYQMNLYTYPGFAKTTIATPNNEFTTDMQIADVDSDGDLDIVVGDGNSGNNVIWLENPRPSGNVFSTWMRHSIGSHPDWVHDVEVGDIDKDGKMDVVTRRTYTNIFFQDGSDSWTKKDISSVVGAGEGLGLGDVDNDGDFDILALGAWIETPSNSRTGTFTKYIVANGWSGEVGATIGDINGDAKPDLIFCPLHNRGSIIWYEAPADPKTGTWTAHIIDNNMGSHKLTLGDLNKDGKLDLVAGLELAELSYYLNDGLGTFTKTTLSTSGIHNQRLGDIDNDGDLDIFGANYLGYPPVELWRNQLNAGLALDKWTYKQVSANHEQTFGLTFGDVNADAKKEIISGHYWYNNPGGDMTGIWTQNSLPAGMHAILVSDVDGDNLIDIIAQKTETNLALYWLEPTTSAATSWNSVRIGEIPVASHVLGAQGYRAAQIELGGRNEILISSGSGIYYFKIPANPTAGNWPNVQVNANPSDEGFAVGDIDRDGDLDIAATTGDLKGVQWYRNPRTGAGNWQSFQIGTFNEALYPDRTELADVNKDDKLDIIVTEENTGTTNDAQTYYWTQPSNPTNTNWVKTLILNQWTTNNLDVADMDKDGDTDIILAEHRGSLTLSIMSSSGSGSFAQQIVDTGKESHLGAKTVDLDNDGDLDIVSIAYDAPQYLHMWRNNANIPGSGTTPPTNQAPSVNAGNDISITLPNNANLVGTASDDGLPSGTLITTWSKVSGPGNVTFGDASALSTTASFSAAGNYVLRLTANDGALSSTSDVSIIVNSSGNCNLTSVYWNQTSALEGSQITLVVNGNNCDGKSVSFVVKEKDYLSADENANINPLPTVFLGDVASTTWIAEYQNDEWGSNPEFYFIATESTNLLNNLKSGLLNVFAAVSDTNAPTISNLQPSGVISTTSVSLSLTTDENAECRYSTTSGVAFASMSTSQSFSGVGTTFHSTNISELINGQSYNYYVKCIDNFGNANTNDSIISFDVLSTIYLNRIVITPSNVSLTLNANQQFNAQGFDQYNNPFSITPTWSVNGGAITQSGFYTANSIGNYLVSATQNGITGNASVLVQSISQDTTPPSVFVTHSPTGSIYNNTLVTISSNASDNVGINQIQIYVDNVLVQTCASSYCSVSPKTYSLGMHNYYAVASDTSNNTARYPAIGSSTFNVSTIASYLNRIVITPSNVSLTLNANQQFNAQGFDQYNNPFSITPTWSVNGGAITQSGFYTANSIGNYLVSATQNGITGNASVFVSSNSSTLTNGLVAYWKFDEIFGTTTADSAGTRTGNLVNGAAFISGKINNAISFDGVNDYVSMSDINLGNTYALSFWFNYQSTSGDWGALFTDYDHSTNDNALFIESGSNKFAFWNNAAYYIGPTLVPNSWHHAVIIVNSGTATLYLDAVNSGTTSNAPSITLSGIGSNRWPEPYKGMLDEVRVYNRTLTASEIQSLANM